MKIEHSKRIDELVYNSLLNEYSEELNPEDIEAGDFVDFGAYGDLYVVKTGDEKMWVTDQEEDRLDPDARGWSINKHSAEKIIAKHDDIWEGKGSNLDKALDYRAEKKELEDQIARLYREMEEDIYQSGEAEKGGGPLTDQYADEIHKLEDHLRKVKKWLEVHDTMEEGKRSGKIREMIKKSLKESPLVTLARVAMPIVKGAVSGIVKGVTDTDKSEMVTKAIPVKEHKDCSCGCGGDCKKSKTILTEGKFKSSLNEIMKTPFALLTKVREKVNSNKN